MSAQEKMHFVHLEIAAHHILCNYVTDELSSDWCQDINTDL